MDNDDLKAKLAKALYENNLLRARVPDKREEKILEKIRSLSAHNQNRIEQMISSFPEMIEGDLDQTERFQRAEADEMYV